RAVAEPEAVEKIIELCSCLPLALATIATRASAWPALALSVIAVEMNAVHGGLNAFVSSDHAANVREVFSWSISALSSAAARLFRLLPVLPVHPGKDFSASPAAAVGDMREHAVVPLLNELVAVHLLTERSSGRYGWHGLLLAYAYEEFEEKVSLD